MQHFVLLAYNQKQAILADQKPTPHHTNRLQQARCIVQARQTPRLTDNYFANDAKVVETASV